ncbi:MAG: hypothetical protein RLO52_42675 [Sandaracinaceae bacterium]
MWRSGAKTIAFEKSRPGGPFWLSYPVKPMLFTVVSGMRMAVRAGMAARRATSSGSSG